MEFFRKLITFYIENKNATQNMMAFFVF